jgi:LPXTG-motif cell wall-anchored protein
MNMNTIPLQWIIVAGVVVVALLAVAAWLFSRKKKQSERLQQRFGPEYGRTVGELGGRTKAESELKAREKRVEHLSITQLSPAEAARFSQAWRDLQGRFVDNPKGVVVQADQLVRELMIKRGYPMGDFERRAADISVDHPAVVENYRAAQTIAARDERGEADTEELRKAVVHYRVLFDEMLDVREAKQEVPSANKEMAVHA